MSVYHLFVCGEPDGLEEYLAADEHDFKNSLPKKTKVQYLQNPTKDELREALKKLNSLGGTRKLYYNGHASEQPACWLLRDGLMDVREVAALLRDPAASSMVNTKNFVYINACYAVESARTIVAAWDEQQELEDQKLGTSTHRPLLKHYDMFTALENMWKKLGENVNQSFAKALRTNIGSDRDVFPCLPLGMGKLSAAGHLRAILDLIEGDEDAATRAAKLDLFRLVSSPKLEELIQSLPPMFVRAAMDDGRKQNTLTDDSIKLDEPGAVNFEAEEVKQSSERDLLTVLKGHGLTEEAAQEALEYYQTLSDHSSTTLDVARRVIQRRWDRGLTSEQNVGVVPARLVDWKDNYSVQTLLELCMRALVDEPVIPVEVSQEEKKNALQGWVERAMPKPYKLRCAANDETARSIVTLDIGDGRGDDDPEQKQIVLYHATVLPFAENIVNRIQVDYLPRRTDFHPAWGFYLTNNFEQALGWARRVARLRGCGQPCVMCFRLEKTLFSQHHRSFGLHGASNAWKRHVFYCRQQNRNCLTEREREAIEKDLEENSSFEGLVCNSQLIQNHDWQSVQPLEGPSHQICIAKAGRAQTVGKGLKGVIWLS